MQLPLTMTALALIAALLLAQPQTKETGTWTFAVLQ